MGSVQSFRDLLAWQRAMKLAESVYRWTSGMPAAERFGLTSQMQRSASSVVFNIAEGWGNGTTAMFIRRLRDARGSLAELDTQLELTSRVYGRPVPDPLVELRADTGRLLQGLIASLERKLEAQEHPP